MADKSSHRKDKAAAFDTALRVMFKRLEARPLPDHITTIVDQLDGMDQKALRKSSAA